MKLSSDIHLMHKLNGPHPSLKLSTAQKLNFLEGTVRKTISWSELSLIKVT